MTLVHGTVSVHFEGLHNGGFSVGLYCFGVSMWVFSVGLQCGVCEVCFRVDFYCTKQPLVVKTVASYALFHHWI